MESAIAIYEKYVGRKHNTLHKATWRATQNHTTRCTKSHSASHRITQHVAWSHTAYCADRHNTLHKTTRRAMPIGTALLLIYIPVILLSLGSSYAVTANSAVDANFLFAS